MAEVSKFEESDNILALPTMLDKTGQVGASVLIGFAEELQSFVAESLVKLDSFCIELKTTGVRHQEILYVILLPHAHSNG